MPPKTVMGRASSTPDFNGQSAVVARLPVMRHLCFYSCCYYSAGSGHGPSVWLYDVDLVTEVSLV